MSDIGIFSGLSGTILVLLILGAPGLPLGAVIGFGLWLLGWLYFSDNL